MRHGNATAATVGIGVAPVVFALRATAATVGIGTQKQTAAPYKVLQV
jgi:hypothetical protein